MLRKTYLMTSRIKPKYKTHKLFQQTQTYCNYILLVTTIAQSTIQTELALNQIPAYRQNWSICNQNEPFWSHGLCRGITTLHNSSSPETALRFSRFNTTMVPSTHEPAFTYIVMYTGTRHMSYGDHRVNNTSSDNRLCIKLFFLLVFIYDFN